MIMYKAFIESHFRYGIIGWGGVLNFNILKLEILQKRVLKIILNKDHTYPSDTLFKCANIMDIRQLFCFTLIIKQHSENMAFTPIEHHYTTRNKNNLKIPKTRKTIGQRCCSYLAPKIFNSLPNEIKEINNKKKFKYICAKYILENERRMFHVLIEQKYF